MIAPDAAEVERIMAALGAGGITAVRLVAESGPEARYRAFLGVLSGAARVVVGPVQQCSPRFSTSGRSSCGTTGTSPWPSRRPRDGTPGRSRRCAVPTGHVPGGRRPDGDPRGRPDGVLRVAGADRGPAGRPARPDAAGPGGRGPRGRPGPLRVANPVGGDRDPAHGCGQRPRARQRPARRVPADARLPVVPGAGRVPAVRPAHAGTGPGSAPVVPIPRRDPGLAVPGVRRAGDARGRRRGSSHRGGVRSRPARGPGGHIVGPGARAHPDAART